MPTQTSGVLETTPLTREQVRRVIIIGSGPAGLTAALYNARANLAPLVFEGDGFELLSGHRRLACALALGLESVPCEIRPVPRGSARRRAVLDYNRQRRKTFSQLMREADALEALLAPAARARRAANLRGADGDRDWAAELA